MLLNVFHAWKQYNENAKLYHDNFLNVRALKLDDNAHIQLARILNSYNLEICSTSFNRRDYYVTLEKPYFLATLHRWHI